jgi:hypothetical protein
MCFSAHGQQYRALTCPGELVHAAQENDWVLNYSMSRQGPDTFPIIRSVPGAWRAQEERDERVRVLRYSR